MQFLIDLGVRKDFSFGPELFKALKNSDATIGVLHNGQSDFYKVE
jgi:hypothetical protein